MDLEQLALEVARDHLGQRGLVVDYQRPEVRSYGRSSIVHGPILPADRTAVDECPAGAADCHRIFRNSPTSSGSYQRTTRCSGEKPATKSWRVRSAVSACADRAQPLQGCRSGESSVHKLYLRLVLYRNFREESLEQRFPSRGLTCPGAYLGQSRSRGGPPCEHSASPLQLLSR